MFPMRGEGNQDKETQVSRETSKLESYEQEFHFYS